jgi:hypothetical protein
MNSGLVVKQGVRLMSQQSRFYVEAKGIKLHFLQYGASGPQVLLLPGIQPRHHMGVRR